MLQKVHHTNQFQFQIKASWRRRTQKFNYALNIPLTGLASSPVSAVFYPIPFVFWKVAFCNYSCGGCVHSSCKSDGDSDSDGCWGLPVPVQAWHDPQYLLSFSQFLLYFEELHFVITVMVDVSTHHESPSVSAMDSSCKYDWDSDSDGCWGLQSKENSVTSCAAILLQTASHDQVSLNKMMAFCDKD